MARPQDDPPMSVFDTVDNVVKTIGHVKNCLCTFCKETRRSWQEILQEAKQNRAI